MHADDECSGDHRAEWGPVPEHECAHTYNRQIRREWADQTRNWPGTQAAGPETKGHEPMTFPPVRSSIPRRAVRAVAVVALSLALGACSSSAKPGASGKDCATTNADAKAVAKLVQKGLQAQIAGNDAEAETNFNEVLCSDPTNKYAHYNLGLIFQNRGKNSDAEAEYNKALDVDAKFGPALYNLAIVRTAAGDNDGAISLYRRAIAVNAKDANAHFNLGLLLRKQGQTTEGNAEVQTAVNLDSSLRAKATQLGVPLTGS
jgi:Tfp pilus assembly protein PilF